MQSSRRIDTAAVLLRTTVGVMFVAHAALKYFVFTLPGTWKFFESQPAGYRQVATWWVISAKREETRDRRLAKIIDVSASGRRAEW